MTSRRAISGALILLLGLLVYAAGKQGVSDFFAQSGAEEMALWATPYRTARKDDLPRVTGYLDQALSYAPRNAWALETLGGLNLRMAGAATDPDTAVAAARAGYAQMRSALKERPTSPFLWTNLARAKLMLGEIDAELFGALRRAGELGPSEPGVQQAAAFIGLAALSKAGPADRDAIVATVHRAARQDPVKMLEIARGFNRVDLICDMKDEDKKLENSTVKNLALETACGRVVPDTGLQNRGGVAR